MAGLSGWGQAHKTHTPKGVCALCTCADPGQFVRFVRFVRLKRRAGHRSRSLASRDRLHADVLGVPFAKTSWLRATGAFFQHHSRMATRYRTDILPYPLTQMGL